MEEERMKMILIASALTWTGSAAFAQNTTCKAQAAEKKLSGAALTSFTKKCEKDAEAACDASAKDKKLAGAAKSSFTRKCVSDAVGA
jgi:hypothetical protein